MAVYSEDLGAAMKQGMRYLASGVGVVTAKSADGERFAMTASSVTSVSDNPPSLLVCVNKSARMDAVMTESDSFAINILAKQHQEVSNNCAKPADGDSRFQLGDWQQCEDSELFYLKDAPSVFICKKSNVFEYGTHNIYIGDITKVVVADEDSELLVYANGAYRYI